MPKLTEKAIRYVRSGSDPNYRKASLSKMTLMKYIFVVIFFELGFEGLANMALNLPCDNFYF